ncbi:MAG: hypothetical protein M1396_06230 [Chloroflexi bacterium]|nr:hypothetical protein [Chloroflexota bacterium]
MTCDAYLQTGGYDVRMFAFSEEIDLQWRARLCGFAIGCCPSAVIFHEGGATVQGGYYRGGSYQLNWQRLYLGRRNTLCMLLKVYEARTLAWVLPLWLTSALVECLGALALRQPRMFWVYLTAIGWNLCHWPGTRRLRGEAQYHRIVPDSAIRRIQGRPFVRLRQALQIARQGVVVD